MVSTRITAEDEDLPTFESTSPGRHAAATSRRPPPRQPRRFTLPGPWPGCGLKRQFLTRTGAESSIWGRKLQRKLGVYECVSCGYWHVGHLRTRNERMGVPIVGLV